MKREGRVLTPQNYQESFCKEAKKSGLVLEECNQLEHYYKKLDKNLQKELKSYHLRSVDELFSFLNGKIARMAPKSSEELVQALLILIKRMAQVAEQMHDKDLAAIARHTAENIEKVQNATAIDKLKDQWINFLTTYDDSYLDRLSVLGEINKEDLKSSVHKLVDDFSQEHDMHIPDVVGKLLIASLVPSIAPGMDDEIAVISSQIRKDINVLDTQGMHDDIKYAINKRINLDKASLKDTVYQLDEIADAVSKRLIQIIEQSEIKKEELAEIKQELENLDMTDKKSVTDIHRRLLDIADILEEEAGELNKEVKSQQVKISAMDKKIMLLENDLQDANKQVREDFLTKLYNKRALEEKMRELDASYRRYGRDFTLFFIDIDHFKKINDTYGHDAGDTVLRIFSKVLKKESRDIDFVARFGGEEFVMLLPETTAEGAKRFAEKLRLILQKNRFVHKEQRIKLTISGGICQRSAVDSIEELVKTADKFVYEAKNAGRNMILPK
jgi:diguanylate cyclase (GGDEF)-like protein